MTEIIIEHQNDIFFNLFSRYGPKTYDYVNVIASTTLNGYASPKVTINPFLNKTDIHDCWASTSTENSYLIIQFNKGIRVNLTEYSIKTRLNTSNLIPRSWILFASNDSLHWLSLDHNVDIELKGNGSTTYFHIGQPAPFRFFKLMMTGSNSYSTTQNDQYIFTFHTLGFYGDLSHKVLPTPKFKIPKILFPLL